MKPSLPKKILVANRGEIAVRVIRACKELGIPSVAVHSTADEDALHVKIADESICIGPAAAKDSYLNISSVLSAAAATGATAIHPGYGFLSENASFTEKCSRSGVQFIGPSTRNIALMGDKARARKVAIKSGVAVVPGTSNLPEDSTEALRVATKEIGFPMILKASAGGGGRGMKVVKSDEEFVKAYESARREVLAAFGDASMYAEKFIETARHVEIQIGADKHKNVIHFGDRDCSCQRRYQKVVEEGPAVNLKKATIDAIRAAAIKISKAISYSSLGTVEFLVDAETEEFFFIEMNTRLQVEHPVTEMICNHDLVIEQIRVASGYELSVSQEDVKISGHSIEARINAEDPWTQVPSPGLVTNYHPPGGNGVRVDSALYDNYRVPPYYDSLVAKVIVGAKDRNIAIQKMRVALDEMVVDGIKTNIDLHKKILADEQFIQAKMNTKMLTKYMNESSE